MRTTDSNRDYRTYPKLYRNRVSDGPNELWVANITYIRLATNFFYLEAVLDAYSRKAVGWPLSRRNNSYDNDQAQSFFKTLKGEEAILTGYRSMKEVKNRLGKFIDQDYNRERLNSALGYVSPVEFDINNNGHKGDVFPANGWVITWQEFCPARRVRSRHALGNLKTVHKRET